MHKQQRFLLGLFLGVNLLTCITTFQPFASLRNAASIALLPAFAAGSWLVIRLIARHTVVQRQIAFQFIPDWQKVLLVGSTVLFVLYLSYYVHFIRTLATLLFSWFLLNTANQFTTRVRSDESYSAKPARSRFAAFGYNPTPRVLQALQPEHGPVATEAVRKKLDFGFTGLTHRRPHEAMGYLPPRAPQFAPPSHASRFERERFSNLPTQANTPLVVEPVRHAPPAPEPQVQTSLQLHSQGTAREQQQLPQQQTGQKRRNETDDETMRQAPAARLAARPTADLFVGLRNLVDSAVKSTKRGLESLVSDSPIKKSAKQEEPQPLTETVSRTRKERSNSAERSQPTKKPNLERGTKTAQINSQKTEGKRKASVRDQRADEAAEKKTAVEDDQGLPVDLSEMMKPSKYALKMYSNLVHGKHRKQEHTVVDPWSPMQARWDEGGSKQPRRRHFRPLQADFEAREKQSLEIAKEVFGGVKPVAATTTSAVASLGSSSSLPSTGFSLPSTTTSAAPAAPEALKIDLNAVNGGGSTSGFSLPAAGTSASTTSGFNFGGASTAPTSTATTDTEPGSPNGRPPFSPPAVAKPKDSSKVEGIATRASDKPENPSLTNMFGKTSGDASSGANSMPNITPPDSASKSTESGGGTKFSFGAGTFAAAKQPATAPEADSKDGAASNVGFSFSGGNRPRSRGIVSDADENESASAQESSSATSTAAAAQVDAPKTAFKLMSEASPKPTAVVQFGTKPTTTTDTPQQVAPSGFSGFTAPAANSGDAKPAFGQPPASTSKVDMGLVTFGSNQEGQSGGFSFGATAPPKPGKHGSTFNAPPSGADNAQLSGFAPAKGSGKSVSFAPSNTPSGGQPAFGGSSNSSSNGGAQSNSQAGSKGGFAFGSKAAEDKPQSKPPQAGGFAFGSKAAEDKPQSKPPQAGGFAFGAPKPSSAASGTPGAMAFGSGQQTGQNQNMPAFGVGTAATGGPAPTAFGAAKSAPVAFGSGSQQSSGAVFGAGQSTASGQSATGFNGGQQNQGKAVVFGAQQSNQQPSGRPAFGAPTGGMGGAAGAGSNSSFGQTTFGGSGKPSSGPAPAAQFSQGQSNSGGMKFGAGQSTSFGAPQTGAAGGAFGQGAGAQQAAAAFGGGGSSQPGKTSTFGNAAGGGGGASTFAFGSQGGGAPQMGAPLSRTTTLNNGMGGPGPSVGTFGGGGAPAGASQGGFSFGSSSSSSTGASKSTSRRRNKNR